MIKQLLCSGLFLCPSFMYAQEAHHKPSPTRQEGTTFSQDYTSATAAALLSGKDAVYSSSDSTRNTQYGSETGGRLARPEGTTTVPETEDKHNMDKP